jgi:hypothetical protein
LPFKLRERWNSGGRDEKLDNLKKEEDQAAKDRAAGKYVDE